MLETLFSSEEIKYTGEQLSSHFGYNKFGLEGDYLVSFVGECDVGGDNLVDMVEYVNKERIYSPRMLHFIGEFFPADLERSVLLQHILSAVVYEGIMIQNPHSGVSRIGNDIFADKMKLSISVATVSRVSSLIHLGLNIESDNIDYPVIDLNALDINYKGLSLYVLESFNDEIEIINKNLSKVRGVD